MLKFKIALKTAFRHRILIASILLVILAFSSGLVLAKGTVMAKAKGPGEITYGDSVSFKSKAFMSDVYFEYSDGGKWSTTAPTAVGEYKVRPCSKGAFGKIKRGKESQFSIVPRTVEVVVSSNELIYGETPTATAPLCNGDQLAFVDFVYDNVTPVGSNITPVAETVTIVNSFGRDVTDCYTVQSKTSWVTTVKRAIEITVTSLEKTYDGIEFASSAYEITNGSLATDDIITASFTNTITDVGTVENVGSFSITANGLDVTEMYDVSVVSGYLTVNPRPITVQTGSAQSTYDGDSLFNTYFAVVGGEGILSNQQIQNVGYTAVTEAGTHENVMDFEIIESVLGGERDVTQNYAFTFEYGTLTVLPRPVTIRSADSTWVYDGTYKYIAVCQQTSAVKLLPGHSGIIESSANIKDVGSMPNEFTYKVTDGARDVTSNYELTLEFGTLTVTPREISLTSQSDSAVYDGEDFSCSLFYSTNVVSFHTVEVIDYTTIKNVGTVDNILSYCILDEGGNDVSGNYLIASESGTLTVTEREVILAPRDVLSVYDGNVHGATEFVLYEYSPNTVVDWHIVNVTFKQGVENQRKYAGVSYSEIDSVIICDPENGGEDVTSNYDLSFEQGRVTVTARTIHLKPETVRVIYDANTHSASSTGIEDVSNQPDQGLVDGDVIDGYTVVGEGGPDVGRYQSRIVANSVIILSNGTDVAHSAPPSYNVVYVDGEIIIAKRPITVKPVDVEKVYDGTPLVATVWEWSENTQYRLAGDHIIYGWEMGGSQTDVGESASYVVSITITTGDYSRVVSDNYEITTEEGVLRVTKRPITVKPVDTTTVYNGEQQRITVAEIAPFSPYGLVLGHRFEYDGNLTEAVGPTVGTYSCSIIDGSVFVASGSGGDISCNYEISYGVGLLTIERREVHIKPQDVMKEYDGLPLTCNTAVVASTSPNPLISHHVITIVTDGRVLNVADGRQDNHIISFSVTEGGVDVSQNYNFVCCTGTLYIYPREITLTAGDATKVYDGQALRCTNVIVTEGSLATRQYISQIEILGERTDVGTADNVITNGSVKIESYGGEDVTSNYRISYEKGTLTVTKRKILFVSDSEEWTYDGEAHSKPTYEGPVYNGPYEGTIPPALVLDHQAVVSATSSITDVGNIDNQLNIIIQDGSANEKTYNYEITVNMGTLTVNPIELTVKTLSGDWDYDGHYHGVADFEYVGTARPISGHTLVVLSATEVIDAVEEADNVLVFDVVNSYGTSYGRNYTVSTVEYGKLTVRPIAIKIQTATNSWTYSGANYEDRGYAVIEGALADTDFINVVSATVVKNVTEEPVLNELGIVIKRGNAYSNVDATNNYVTETVYGTLEVTPLAVTLKPFDSAEYNGEEQSAEELVAIGGTSLVSLHRATAQTNEAYIDVGSYSSTIVDGTVVIVDGQSVNVTSNYDITYAQGEFTITQRLIYVIAGDDTKVYDGTPLTCQEYEVRDLLGIHAVASLDITGEITDVGVEENVPSNLVITTLGGDPVNMGNYNVRYVNGTLRVTPIVIKVKTGSATKRFDGEPLSCEEYDIVSGNPLEGHFISIRQSAFITNPGVKANNMMFDVTNEDGTETYTHNYKFTNTEPGILEITPVRVTVSTGSATKYYDGTPLTCDEYEIFIEGGEVENHDVQVTVIGTITDPGEERNEFEFVAIYNGTDVSAGYEVTAEWGMLTVLEKIKVDLKPRDEIKVYDGIPLVATEIEGFEVLADLGYYYENLVFGGSQLEYGRSASYIESIDIYDAEDNPISNTIAMFDLTYSEGVLEVTKTQVIIRLFDVSKYYDGTPISYYEDDYIVVDSKGLTLDIRLGGQLTDVGKLTYDDIREASYYRFYDAYGYDVTDNYYLLIEGNPLEVKARNIEVRSIDASKKYDSEALTSNRAWVSQGSLVSGHVITFTITASITHVGSIENKIDNIVIMSGGVDVTENYNIEKIYGTLVVEPME